MGLIAIGDPTPKAGEDIDTSAGTLAVINRFFVGTFPNATHIAAPYYSTANPNYRFRIAPSGVISPREGSHSYMLRVRESDAYFQNGGKSWDRADLQTGNLYPTFEGDEKWWGFSEYWNPRLNEPNSDGSMPQTSFHNVGEEHDSLPTPGVNSLWTINHLQGGTTRIYFYREDGAGGGIQDVQFLGPWWELSTWIDWVINFKMAPSGGGWFHVWSRKWPAETQYTKLVTYTGPTSITGDKGRFELKTYRGAAAPKWGRERFISTIRVGDHTSSFAEVEPGQSAQGPSQVATPTITPGGGTYASSQTVTLASTTSGATMIYTTDGTAPTVTNGTQIPSGNTVNVTVSLLLRVIAIKAGLLDSPEAQANYTINASAPTAPIRINCGGSGFTDSNSNSWGADQYFNGGSVGAVSSNPISNAASEDQILYQTARWWAGGATGSYQIPITNGDYAVRLHYAETNASTQAVGARVFDVSIEGALVTDDLDVFAQVGPNAALVGEHAVSVSDGVLDITLTPSIENAAIKGIEILDISTSEGTGNVLVEPAQIVCPTSTGTFNFTATALGSEVPKGAIFWVTKGITNGTVVAGACIGLGYTDGVSEWACGILGVDNVTTGTTARRRAMSDKCVFLMDEDGSTLIEGEWSQWIAGGIEINLTTAPASGYRINALFIAGSDAECYVTTVSSGTSGTAINVTGAGFEPTDVLASTIGLSDGDNLVSGAILCLGMATNRASTITQHCIGYEIQNQQFLTRVYGDLVTDAVCGEIRHVSSGVGRWDYLWTVSDFDSQGCSFTPTDEEDTVDSGDALGVILMRLPNVSTSLVQITSPGAPSATESTTGVGYEPVCVLELFTRLTAIDSVAANDTASSLSIGAFSAGVEVSAGVSFDDGQSTTDANCVVNNKATHLLDKTGGNALIADLVSLDSGGWTKDYTTAIDATKGFAWPVETSTSQQVPVPSIDPNGGVFSAASVTVTLSSVLAGVSLYYTTDGTTPDSGDTLYSVPFAISVTTTIKVIGIKSGLSDSEVAIAVFTLQPTAETPVISPGTGSYGGPVEITITSGTPSASIHYTTDGTTPDSGDTLYSGAFTISAVAANTVKAIAIKAGFTDSAIASEVITVTATVETPVIEPPTKTYRGPVLVEISCATAGVAIWITTDGTTPEEDGVTSSLFTQDFLIYDDTTIKAIGVLSGFTDSAVATSVIETRLHRVHAKRLRDRGL